MVVTGIVLTIIDPDHKRRVHALAGGGNDHLAGTRAEVLLASVPIGKPPGALQHHIHLQFMPGRLSRIGHFQALVSFASNDQFIVGASDFMGPDPMHGVIPQQICEFRRC